MSMEKNIGKPVIKLGRKLSIGGKKGESLFYDADIFNSLIVMDKNFVPMSKQLTKYANLVYRAKEERLLALIGAISVEEALDSLLGAYIPNYKLILENTDFTFSMKVEIAYSLNLIPKHILNSSDLVRKIRNKFAHDINVDRFEYLDKRLKDNLKVRFKEFYHEEDFSSMAYSELFVEIIQSVVSALDLYKYYGKAAKEYIYSEDFIKELNRRIEDKSKKVN